MNRRGLTLVELLVSLALLGLLSTALTAWAQMSARASAQADASLPWRTAAEALLQRIQEDLLVGDLASPKTSTSRATTPAHRVKIIDGRLIIRTRSKHVGSCEHIYDLHRESAAVNVTQRVSTDARPSGPRVLLGDVASWDCELDVQARLLAVRLISTRGQALGRSFRWP